MHAERAGSQACAAVQAQNVSCAGIQQFAKRHKQACTPCVSRSVLFTLESKKRFSHCATHVQRCNASTGRTQQARCAPAHETALLQAVATPLPRTHAQATSASAGTHCSVAALYLLACVTLSCQRLCWGQACSARAAEAARSPSRPREVLQPSEESALCLCCALVG